MRAFAALAVYLSHAAAPHGSPRWLVTLFGSGYMGVTVFFVLSGFVLSISYFDALSHPTVRAVWSYAVSRIARIYPVYLLGLFFVMLTIASARGSITGWWQNALMIQTWSSNIATAYSFDAPEWSVSVELFLYACLPLLVLLLARLRRPRSLLVTAACVALAMTGITTWFALSGHAALPLTDGASAHRWLYRNPALRLGDFTLGILAARLYRVAGTDRRAVRAGTPIVAVGIVVIIGLMAWPKVLGTAWTWDLAYAVPAVAIIFGLAVTPRGLITRMLSVPAIVLLGEASYAFYIFHQPLLEHLGLPWRNAATVATLLYGVMELGIIVCLAVGVHILIERPARVYIRRLASRPRLVSAPEPAGETVLPEGVREGALR